MQRRFGGVARIRTPTAKTGGPRRANGRATAERILRYGREELVKSGAIDFNLDRVLRRSKVSRSSIYHHFGSREGLIITLEVERLFDEVMQEMEILRAFLLGSSDHEEIFGSIEFALAMAGEEAGRLRRRHRIESLAAASKSPGLRSLLSESQAAGSHHFAETLRLAAERGTFVTTLPVDGISYVIQSLFVGRILVDLTDDPTIDREWVATAMSVIRHLLGAPPSHRTRG